MYIEAFWFLIQSTQFRMEVTLADPGQRALFGIVFQLLLLPDIPCGTGVHPGPLATTTTVSGITRHTLCQKGLFFHITRQRLARA